MDKRSSRKTTGPNMLARPSAIVAYQAGENEERPWGRWSVLETGGGFCVKRIEVDPGQRLSLQLHNHRSEDWIIVSGRGLVDRDKEQIHVQAGDCVRIARRSVHRIHNTGDQLLIFIEVQHGNLLDEEDIIRIEDDYGR